MEGFEEDYGGEVGVEIRGGYGDEEHYKMHQFYMAFLIVTLIIILHQVPA